MLQAGMGSRPASEFASWAFRAATRGILGVLCACDQRFWVCEPPDEAALSSVEARLSETGLYAEIEGDVLAPDVIAYRPSFELWSDGASKRRWLRLPAGTRIDTQDMDAWRFPEGTKLWKEFSRDGVRIETRLLHKVGPSDGDWVAIAYLWSADQRDAFAASEGAIDALDTRHNVPAAGECMACHGGTRSRVLGFAAIQLSSGTTSDEGSVAWLEDHDLLTHPPASALVVPGNETERAALGYLHANCAHCHNQARPNHSGARCYEPDNELDFRLLSTDLESVVDTQTYRTIDEVVRPGRPDDSHLINRVAGRDSFQRMPPLATEQTNQDAVVLLRRWIAELERDDVR